VRYIAVYVRPKAVYLSELQDWITHGKESQKENWKLNY